MRGRYLVNYTHHFLMLLDNGLNKYLNVVCTLVTSILFIFVHANVYASGDNFDLICNINEDKVSKVKPLSFIIKDVDVIDGTGSDSVTGQNLAIAGGYFVKSNKEIFDKKNENTLILNGKGKTIIPGFIMMHEHIFYPTSENNYMEMLNSFPALYLAGGATTIRTAGSMNATAVLNLKKRIDLGLSIGPDIDVSAPFMNGPGLPILKMKELDGIEDVKRQVNYWIKEGVTSFKAYTNIRATELQALINQAHHNNVKVTGHLCSITYRDAANMGIDNIEHGFVSMTDFVVNKKDDQCPSSADLLTSLSQLDLASDEVSDLISTLVKSNVAITSTLPVLETFVSGRPKASKEALSMLIPSLRKQYDNKWLEIRNSNSELMRLIYAKSIVFEKLFVEAGGTLLVGTDPTGYGGVIAGFSNQRAVELLVESGFSIEEAITFSTLNGARYLGVSDYLGTIKTGKKADFIVVEGNLASNYRNINKIKYVFKDGICYNSNAIKETYKGMVGLQ